MAEEVKSTKKVTKKIPANKNVEYTATGRRKNSIARVRLTPNGKGNFVINKKNIRFLLYHIEYDKTVTNKSQKVTAVFVDIHKCCMIYIIPSLNTIISQKVQQKCNK